MLRVTFVCTGNICRSPAAHAVFAAAVTEARGRRELWAERVMVESAGLGSWHEGELPDPRARAEGTRRGYTLDHPARQIARVDFDGLLVAMDRGHEQGLRLRAPTGFPADQLFLLRRFDPMVGHPADVADPYYSDGGAFSEMFDVIVRSMPGLVTWVRGRVEGA